MNQREHIELLIRNSEKQSEKVQKVQQIYLEYFETKDENVLQNLIFLLDSYWIGWVRKTLWKTGCYDEENEHTILQEARIAVWKKISEDLKQSVVQENFIFYVFGVYKNKTMTLIRKTSKERSLWGIDKSLDAFDDNMGKTLGDVLKAKETGDEEIRERKEVYISLIYIYCKTFMNYKTFPPRNLALYYARILPHLLHINHEIETIPDTKATSAKWAFEKMGKRVISQLKEDSEKLLQAEIDSNLKWGEAFDRQLEEEIVWKNEKYLLKDIIYTEVYDKGKIEDWADYMHKITVKHAKEEIVKDSFLLETAKKYISRKEGVYGMLEGGKDR